MKHFSLEQTLDRINRHRNDQDVDVSPIIANLMVPKTPATATAPVAPTPPIVTDTKTAKPSDDDNTDDNEEDDGSEDEDGEDSGDDDSEDDEDEIETFPSTPVTQPIYDGLQEFSTQAQVVAEIINQVEGFKAKGDTDKTNQAVAALRSALSDMSDMQNKCKTSITDYLTKFKGS